MSGDRYVMPTSPGQEWMWLIHHKWRGSSPYHIGGAFRVRGPLDVDMLGQCLTMLTERHEVLRTVFRLEPRGELSQVIRDTAPVNIRVVDESADDLAVDEPARWEQVLAWCTEFADEPFDLARGPLMRAAVVHVDADQHAVVLIFHHIISDGWSLNIVMTELSDMYAHMSAGITPDLVPPELQYADFAIWHREWLGSAHAAEQLSSWQARLHGARPLILPVNLPAQDASASETTFAVRVEPATVSGLRTVARSGQATLFMVLLSAVTAVFARWSGQTDLVLGTPVAGRTRPELEGTVGFFVNTLPLRVDASGDPSFATILRRARATCAHAFDHQELPYERIVRLVSSSAAHNPRLATVMCALRNLPAVASNRITGITLEPIETAPRAGDFDIFMEFMEEPDGGLRCSVAGGPQYCRRTIQLVARSIVAVLRAVVTNAESPLSQMPMLLTPDTG